jgi:hypothetical protein
MYGMVGIGIAAAVGFVFALSLLSNSGIIGNGGSQQPADELQQQKRESTNSEEDAATLQSDDGQANMKATTTAPADNDSGALEMQAATGNLKPALASLVVLNSQREVLEEVREGMEFKAGEAVFIQGIMHNPHGIELPQQSISLTIVKGENGEEPEGIATFNGIIPVDGNVAVDLYWKPVAGGDYRITLSLDDDNNDNPAEPVAAVQVRVVD